MRSMKIVGMLVILALVVSAVASASAFALPELLGTIPTSITGTSGESEVKDPASGLVIKCKSAKVSGKVLSATTSEEIVDFQNCKIGGLATQSLGDKGGNILVPVTSKQCYINKAAKVAGMLYIFPTGGVHVEVPSLGELLVLTGSVVGWITPVNSSSTTETANVDSRLKCEGAKAPEDTIKIEKEHNGEPLEGEALTTESLTLGNALTLDA